MEAMITKKDDYKKIMITKTMITKKGKKRKKYTNNLDSIFKKDWHLFKKKKKKSKCFDRAYPEPGTSGVLCILTHLSSKPYHTNTTIIFSLLTRNLRHRKDKGWTQDSEAGKCLDWGSKSGHKIPSCRLLTPSGHLWYKV